MVLGNPACATCGRICYLDAVRAATATRTNASLDVRLYYAAIHNLVYRCGNVPQTIAESNDIPAIHCAQLVQQSIDMSIQLPAGLQCDPVQMNEVVQQEYVLVGVAWLYHRVNFAFTSESTTVAACKVTTEGARAGPWAPSDRDDCNKWITNTTTPSVCTYYTVVPMNTILEVVTFLFPTVYILTVSRTYYTYWNLFRLIV